MLLVTPSPSSGGTAFDYWTLGIAILGAVTGVLALFAQVWAFLWTGPRVRVVCTYSWDDQQGWYGVVLEVRNLGRTATTLRNAGLIFDEPKIDSDFPGMPHRMYIAWPNLSWGWAKDCRESEDRSQWERGLVVRSKHRVPLHWAVLRQADTRTRLCRAQQRQAAQIADQREDGDQRL